MINENEQNYTEEEVTQEEPVAQEETTPDKPVQDTETELKDQKQNWRDLREKADRADRLQRERDEYYAMLKKIEENYLTQSSQKQDESFDINTLDDDDLPDGKTLKKIFKQQQKEREHLQEYVKRQNQVQYENTVKSELFNRFGDFDDVVNEENIVRLREMRPGLARSLHMNPDIREKAIETYYAIKDLGIYENNTYKQERNKMQENVKKPRSINTVQERGTDPLNFASAAASDGLTPELKRKLYEDALKKSGRG